MLLYSGKTTYWPSGLLQKTGVLAFNAIDLCMKGLALNGCVEKPPGKLWQLWCEAFHAWSWQLDRSWSFRLLLSMSSLMT